MTPRIALDVDGVLANFVKGVLNVGQVMGLGKFFPETWDAVDHWKIGYGFEAVWAVVKGDPMFWYTLESHDTYVSFTPAAYVTHRPCDPSITNIWLRAHDFPNAPVVNVTATSKVDELKRLGVDAYVDDRSKNFLEINEDSDIVCYLFDRPWNRNVAAGLLRISDLRQVATTYRTARKKELA